MAAICGHINGLSVYFVRTPSKNRHNHVKLHVWEWSLASQTMLTQYGNTRFHQHHADENRVGMVRDRLQQILNLDLDVNLGGPQSAIPVISDGQLLGNHCDDMAVGKETKAGKASSRSRHCGAVRETSAPNVYGGTRWMVGGKRVSKREAKASLGAGGPVVCVSGLHGGGCGTSKNASRDAAMRSRKDEARGSKAVVSFGINRPEMIKALSDIWGSMSAEAPMRVVRYKTFRSFGKIPRFSDRQTLPVTDLADDTTVVFISHRWLRPDEDAGISHPDSADNTQHALISAGVERLAMRKGWDIDKLCLWLDFSCVEQDDEHLVREAIASLPAYISICDAMLIPSPSVPADDVRTTDEIDGGYGQRAWTRLECLSFFAISKMKQCEPPDIWVTAGKSNSLFLERFDYVLTDLPSQGEVFYMDDMTAIQSHEEVFLKHMKQCVQRNGYIAKHVGPVRCVAFHPTDHELVASAGEDGKVRLIHRDTGAAKKCFTGHQGAAFSVAISPDGTMMASGGRDHTLRLWGLGDEVPRQDFVMKGHSNAVSSVAFRNDSTYLASGSWDKTVTIWDLSGDTPTESWSMKGHLGAVNCVAWSPNGLLLASGSADMTLRIWDPATGKDATAAALEGHSAQINSLAWSPDGGLLASCSDDLVIRIWSSSGQEQGAVLAHTHVVSSLAWSPDGDLLASSSDDGTVRLWSARGEEVGFVTGHTSIVSCLEWCPNGSHLACACDDGMVRILGIFDDDDAASNKNSINSRSSNNKPSTADLNSVHCVVLSPNGKLVATAGNENSVRVWDIATCKEVTRPLVGHTSRVYTLAFSPDSATLASGSSDTKVKLWNAATGLEKLSLKGHSNYVRAVSWAPDGSALASASDDRTVRIWSPTGEEKRTLKAVARCLAWSPDGRHLATAGNYIVRVWDASTGKEAMDPMTGHSDWVHTLGFSPDGRLIASGSYDLTVRVWDVAAGAEAMDPLAGDKFSWVGPVNVQDSKVHEDKSSNKRDSVGQHIVTCDSDQVRIYKLVRGWGSEDFPEPREVAKFHAQVNVSSLCCIGQRICAGCEDGQVLFLEAPLLSLCR